MASRWALVSVMVALVVGCVTTRPPQAAAPARVERPRLVNPAPDDLVLIDVAMLERPVGDFYLNARLWESADEQAIPPERRGAVEDNGFRLGIIGGMLPAELQDLLASKRSCPDPRRIQTHAGNVTSLPVGPSLPRCQFNLHDDGKMTAVQLRSADGVLRVTPSFAENGRTRLEVVPELLHGDTALLPRPAADRSGWELHQHRATESYAASGWDVTLAPGQYLIVGARFDRPETLGHRLFIRADPTPVQYLLLIRAGRMQPPSLTGATEDEGTSRQTPSLARQVGQPPVPKGRP